MIWMNSENISRMQYVALIIAMGLLFYQLGVLNPDTYRKPLPESNLSFINVQNIRNFCSQHEYESGYIADDYKTGQIVVNCYASIGEITRNTHFTLDDLRSWMVK